jgi:pimeloyl-ACP methyl ester carboxylesterase
VTETFTTPAGITLSYERRGSRPLLVCRNEKVGLLLAADFAQAETLHHFDTVEFPTLDLRGELSRIEAPTLVVAGDHDFICGPACANAIAGALPDARLVTIPDSGHFVYVEQPEAFRAALTGFLL